jgi:hypothetical protein
LRGINHEGAKSFNLALDDSRHSTGGYYVAVDTDARFVYVYLGNSEQLFAFKIVE